MLFIGTGPNRRTGGPSSNRLTAAVELATTSPLESRQPRRSDPPSPTRWEPARTKVKGRFQNWLPLPSKTWLTYQLSLRPAGGRERGEWTSGSPTRAGRVNVGITDEGGASDHRDHRRRRGEWTSGSPTRAGRVDVGITDEGGASGRRDHRRGRGEWTSGSPTRAGHARCWSPPTPSRPLPTSPYWQESGLTPATACWSRSLDRITEFFCQVWPAYGSAVLGFNSVRSKGVG